MTLVIRQVRLLKTTLLQVKKKKKLPTCFWIGGRILFVGIGMIALCKMWRLHNSNMEK